MTPLSSEVTCQEELYHLTLTLSLTLQLDVLVTWLNDVMTLLDGLLQADGRKDGSDV